MKSGSLIIKSGEKCENSRRGGWKLMERIDREKRKRNRERVFRSVNTYLCSMRNNFDRVLPVAEIVWVLDRI